MSVRLPKVGDRVNVIEKRNYESGQLTSGTVRRTLSNPHEVHPRGNKVELTDGTVGRMVSFVDEVGLEQSVDPALREEYAREVRDQRSEMGTQRPENRDRRSDDRGSGVADQRPRPEDQFPRTGGQGPMRDNRPQGSGNQGPQRDFPDRPDRFDPRDRRAGGAPPPEPPVKPSDLPGEDDLR